MKGSTPMSQKEKFALYLEPEIRERIDRMYKADNCFSRTEFIAKAVRFYLGYLDAHEDNPLLPAAISSVIEGRLDSFEDRLSRLLFKQTVELSMMMNILAYDIETDETALEKLRGKCVADVKRTNGRLTFREILREAASCQG